VSRYARLEIALIILLGGGLTAVVAYYLKLWALLPAVLALALLAFYRDPPRRVPRRDNVLVAPADGRITEITRDYRAADESGPLLRVVIFLSVLDAHINRSPCAGQVTDVTYRAGRFLNALKAESTDRNESNLVTIEPRPPIPGPVRVRQIAGVLARRIVCAAEPGDHLTTGERFGMIKLGSRTELCVREDARWQLSVHVGEHVKAGLTVLAELREQ
jgi:phosphatidylserine decarboxylase